MYLGRRGHRTRHDPVSLRGPGDGAMPAGTIGGGAGDGGECGEKRGGEQVGGGAAGMWGSVQWDRGLGLGVEREGLEQ